MVYYISCGTTGLQLQENAIATSRSTHPLPESSQSAPIVTQTTCTSSFKQIEQLAHYTHKQVQSNIYQACCSSLLKGTSLCSR